MDNLIYKERRLSKTEEMFHAVFSSKAVLAILILSCIVFVSNMVLGIMCGYATRNFTLENLDNYIEMIPYYEDPSEMLENMYISLTNVSLFLFALAIVYFGIALGMLLIYTRAKRLEPQKPIRAGFTIFQAFGIIKLVLEGLPTIFFFFIGLSLLQSVETFIAGVIILAFIAVNFMYTIGIIVFCSSVKRTADGIIATSSGAGILQFSSFFTGIVQGIASLLMVILLFTPIDEIEDISLETLIIMENIRLYALGVSAVSVIASVIHFLVFAVAKHYAVKLPLAVNADRVYQNNMSNLYPQNIYDPNQAYQSPQMPYPSNQTYQSPQPTYPYNQTYQSPQSTYPYNQTYQSPQPPDNYIPFQPPDNYVPYDPQNDVNDHSKIDNTQYPPYEPTEKQ